MGGKRGRKLSKEDKLMAISLINESHKAGCRLKVACTDLEINFKTYKRWMNNIEDCRCGPVTCPANKLTIAEENKIIEIATSSEYVDMSPWIIVSKLADKGIYIASESSFYKVLKREKMLQHRGKARPKNNSKPKELCAIQPNQIWSWDITYLRTSVIGSFYFLYLFMDIFSRKIVGFEIREKEDMYYSACAIEKIYKREKINEGQLILHSDNGGPMKGATMLATLKKLKVIPSFSRPKVSNDNPYSESLFKTYKYFPENPEIFQSINHAIKWTELFVDWYNNHPHSGIKYVTPNQRHNKLDIEILKKRNELYIDFKEKNPLRWGGRKTRNWDYQEVVYLNNIGGKNKK